MEKKASAKKTTKKATKLAKKAVPKKTARKLDVKKTTKKVAKPRTKKTVVVKPVTDSTRAVTLRSVDDVGSASEGEAGRVEPTVDKDTGVVTMVPVSK